MTQEPEPLADPQAELQDLRRQHSELSRRLTALEKQWGVSTRVRLAGSSKPAQKLDLPTNLEQLIGLQGFSWLGILALVTGMGLFIRYAFVEGWLGPLAILLGGALTGTGMILAGEWVARKALYRTWAHALMGGGIAVLYFLVYAGYHFDYFRQVTHLEPLSDTLLLMALVGLAIYLALRRQSQSLASRAFVLGFVTSLLSKELVVLTLVYNLILSAGLVGVAAYCRWQGLGLVGVIGSYALHGLWYASNPEQVLLGQGVLLVYFALYALVIDQLEHRPATEPALQGSLAEGAGLNSGYIRPDAWLPAFWKSTQALGLVNLAGYAALALGMSPKLNLWQGLGANGLWLALGLLQQSRLLPRRVAQNWQQLFFMQAVLVVLLNDWVLQSGLAEPTHARSLMLLGWTAGSVAWAHGLKRWEADWLRKACHWLAAICLAGFFALEVPMHGLGLVWSLEALGLLWLGRQRPHLWLVAQWLVIAIPVHLCLQDFAVTGALPVLRGFNLLMSGLSVLVLLLIAVLASETQVAPQTAAQEHGLNWPAGIALTCWLAFALPANWLSMAWTLAGAGLVLAGFLLKRPLLRFQGLGLLLLAGVKVFLQDLSALAMGWRILSLLVLGGLLLGVSLVYTRRQHKSEPQPTPAPKRTGHDIS